MVSEPEWCAVPCGYAAQAVLRDVSAHVVQEVGRFATPLDAYPPGDTVFLLTRGQYYGCLATVPKPFYHLNHLSCFTHL
jgi:hypothetical protein